VAWAVTVATVVLVKTIQGSAVQEGAAVPVARAERGPVVAAVRALAFGLWARRRRKLAPAFLSWGALAQAVRRALKAPIQEQMG
jgi:hypothetical protein